RNGIPDTIEELLLVRDVTPQLLFGLDTNRNGVLDAGEPASDSLEGVDNSDGSMNCGWAAFLTLYSAESNLQSDGTAKINLNQDDLQKLHDALAQALDGPTADLVCAYRQRGASANIIPATPPTDLTKPGSTKLQTVLDLVGLQMGQPAGPQGKPSPPMPPLLAADTAAMGTYLPKFQDKTTTSSNPSIPGRINVNQAPQAVLRCIPGLTEDLVQQIIARRTPDPATADPGRTYGTWLLTEGIVTFDAMKKLMPLVTGGGSVYRAQVAGFYEAGQPVVRLEAIIDATKRPARVVSWKDLTRLGGGYSLDVLLGGTAAR
ncbi:MAG: hypothetical protein ABR915_22950, partial [Thermoguttaceae bacterium]